jgi:hypothetical protein
MQQPDTAIFCCNEGQRRLAWPRTVIAQGGSGFGRGPSPIIGIHPSPISGQGSRSIARPWAKSLPLLVTALRSSTNISSRFEPDALPLETSICGEWLQWPENVLGHLTWSDIRPNAHPRHIRIEHHKTGEKVLHQLEVVLSFPNSKPILADCPKSACRSC